jgi:hypothetical protein
MIQHAVLGALLALGACAVPVGSPAGLASVRAEPLAASGPPLARGETQLVVRAVAEGAPGQELAGASCRADSAYFTAAFVAPAVVRLPDYGDRAPSITVRCSDGTRSGSAVARPEAVWQRGFGGFPVVGVAVGTGGAGVGMGVGWQGGGAGAAAPAIRYPELRVPLA